MGEKIKDYRYNHESLRYGFTPLTDKKIRKIVESYPATDKEGYMYMVTIRRLRMGQKPDKMGKNPFAVHNLSLFVEKEGCKFIGMNEDYHGEKTKFRYVARCGHEKENSVHGFMVGKGRLCNQCARFAPSQFSLTSAEKNKSVWQCIKAQVYIAEIKNDNEAFYKIGLTTRDAGSRVGEISCGNEYNCNIVKTIDVNLYDGVYLEKLLHEKHESYSYIPRVKFGGYTECYSKYLGGDDYA